MRTITKEFTKEQLIARANHLLCVGKAFIAEHPEYDGMVKDVELFAIALASLDNGYDITAQQLREAVHYNPETGEFTRRSNGKPLGFKNGTGYTSFSLFNRDRQAHRMAYYYMTGRLPETIDHIDGNRRNNEWKNLREATQAENQWNKSMMTTNSSGVKGVYWHNKLAKWVAEIRMNGVKYYVGSYNDLEQAKKEIDARRKLLHGCFYRPESP